MKTLITILQCKSMCKFSVFFFRLLLWWKIRSIWNRQKHEDYILWKRCTPFIDGTFWAFQLLSFKNVFEFFVRLHAVICSLFGFFKYRLSMETMSGRGHLSCRNVRRLSMQSMFRHHFTKNFDFWQKVGLAQAVRYIHARHSHSWRHLSNTYRSDASGHPVKSIT